MTGLYHKIILCVSAIRDYINVLDLASAHVVSIERLLSGKNETALEVFNLGTGKGLSVLEMINAFVDATGVEFKYKIVNRRDGDIEQVWADTSRANKVLGWKAGTSIEDTLRSAWNWEQNLKFG